MQEQQLWGDNSLQIGAFVYLGKAKLASGHEDGFRMFGGDIGINYQNLKLNSGIAFRTDDHPYTEIPMINIGTKSRVVFSEVDIMLYPWLIPTLRYEDWFVEQKNGKSFQSQHRFIPTLQILMRANVRSYFSMVIENNNDSETGEIELGLLFGF